MCTVAEYGSWDSPITPEVFGSGNAKAINELYTSKNGVFWVEQNSVTGDRELYYCSHENSGSVRIIRWARGYSLHNTVHEYGGGVVCPLADGSVLFTTIQGVFHQKNADEEPVKMVDGLNNKLRFADITSNGLWAYCVLEDHTLGQKNNPYNRLLMIDLQSNETRDVAKGCDFYASPRLHPNGTKLVWMQWNHINMPWDETTIMIADVKSDGSSDNERVLLSGLGQTINYYCPQWSPNGQLFIVCDKTNYWNIYEVDLERVDENGNAIIHNIFPTPAEIGFPLWIFGDRPFATNGSSSILNINGHLKLVAPNSVFPIDTPDYTVFSYLSITDNNTIYCIAQGPRRSPTVLKIEINNSLPLFTLLRESRDSSDIDSFPISIPREISFESDGDTVTGWFYSPFVSALFFIFSPPVGTLPPVILMGHGGSTAPAWDVLDFRKQFYTSRGFAVFDVNYRGSTGFGTDFRRKLYGQWGVVDRNDMINGAKSLIEKKLVEPTKICITGRSAGGFLLLSCLLEAPTLFSAAVSACGVADLEALAKETHKFEVGYSEVMTGKYPEDIELFRERSPIYHLGKLNTPIAFFHGKEDTVVPPSQSIQMYERLKEKGVTTALMLFDGEGHGFSSAYSNRHSTEGSYYFMCKVLGIEPSIQSELNIVNLHNTE